MVLATSHPHTVLDFTGSDTLHGHVVYAFPLWALVLVYVAILGVLIAGVVALARAAKRMSRPGRIVVGLVAVWTIVSATVVFLDAYRPTDDWRGGAWEGFFVVLYGLVAAGIVCTVDRAARRFRATSPV